MEIKQVVKRKIPFLFVGMLVLSILSSCGASKISIEVLQPPEMAMSGPVSKIAILDRTNVNYAKTSQYVNGQIIAQYTNMTPVMIQESMATFTQVFNDNGFAYAIDTSLANIPKKGHFRSAIMPLASVNRTCKTLQVDAIVAIEGFSAEIDTDSEIQYSTPVDRTYGTVRVPYFTGDQSVYMVMLFRTYMCNNGTPEIDLDTELGTQVSNSSSSSSYQEMENKLADAQNVMVQASRALGTEFANNIGPNWKTVNRKIFSDGNEQMRKAYDLAKKGNWPAAADIWYVLASSPITKIASRASFNLICASEVAGDLMLAEEWANLCATKYGMNDATVYLSILAVRKKQIERIHTLFPSMADMP